jgi:hypothetical protein
VLYLGTPDVFHHSSPPTTTGTRCLLGLGLAANKNVITGLKNELINILKGKPAELLTKIEQIPENLNTAVIEKFLNILPFSISSSGST